LKKYAHDFFNEKMEFKPLWSKVIFSTFFSLLEGPIRKWTKINVQKRKAKNTFEKNIEYFYFLFSLLGYEKVRSYCFG